MSENDTIERGERAAIREEERRRIAREIHDDLGQLLAALRFDLHVHGRRLQSDEKSNAAIKLSFGTLAESVERVTDGLRRLLQGFRPVLIEDLGLAGALDRLARDAGRRGGLTVVTELDRRLDELDASVALALFRTCQELVTNVARHASARTLVVEARRGEAEALLVVSDDGEGFDPRALRPGALGLRGVMDRLAPLGGELELARRDPRGTRALVRVPLVPSRAHEQGKTAAR